MKALLHILFILTAAACFAQPTGHQKLFLEITDKGDTLHFENSFNNTATNRLLKLDCPSYQLTDISYRPDGFGFYPPTGFIHKTLMTDDHRIQIVKNKTDTMDIEILNAFRVYFLSIAFQRGHFRLYVNDGKEHQWLVNALPFKELKAQSTVYDITPRDWSVFQVNSSKSLYDYFISTQFEKQQLLVKPVIPEDDPNFRNPRRINNLRTEVADYNFDGQKDYREHKMKDTTRWNYFIYTNPAQGYVLDRFLSNLDYCYFDFEKKTFLGSKTTRVNPAFTQMFNYEYINGAITLVRQMDCVHAFSNSEKMDCSVYELKNGVMVFKELIKGCE